MIKSHSRIYFMLITFLMSAAIFIGFTVPAHANPKYASIVMDAETGMILHQRYANKRLHPASLTKVMTLLMLFEAMERGEVRLHDRIRISKKAASMQPSKIGFKPGETIKVKDAIAAIVTKSANDVAVAIAEHLATTEGQFARQMTMRARKIGMSNTSFRNASGLHHPQQISTARDMAKMARYVIQEYPDYYRYYSMRNFSYGGRAYRNHNRLLGAYEGMDGMKTGYINASGFNLVASAVRSNRRIIGVVFGGRTSKSRNAHMRTLLDRGFERLGEVRQASIQAPIPAAKPNTFLAAARLNDIAPAAGLSTRHSSSLRATPGVPVAVATVQKEVIREEMPTEQGSADPMISRWALLNPSATPAGVKMHRGTSQLSKRIEAGMITASAHMELQKNHPPKTTQSALIPRPAPQPDLSQSLLGQARSWAIQVGAFQTQQQSASALQAALSKLPQYYAQARPVIVPLQTSRNRMYRARLSGYTSQDAYAACAYIKECITIAP